MSTRVAYITPSKQAYVDSAFPTTVSRDVNTSFLGIGNAAAAASNIWSGYDTYFNQGTLNTWLTFSLTEIPIDSTINSVQLQFIVDAKSGVDYNDSTFYVNKSTGSFSENTLTWNNAPNTSLLVTPSVSFVRIDDLSDSNYYPTRGTSTYNSPFLYTLTTSDIIDSLPTGEVVYRITNDGECDWALTKQSGFKLIVNYTENSSTAAKLFYDGELATFDEIDERLPAVLDGLLYHYPLDFTDESTGTWNKNGNYSTTGKKSIQDIIHSYIPKIEQGTKLRFTGWFKKTTDMSNQVRYFHYYQLNGSWVYNGTSYFQSEIGTDWTYIEKTMTIPTTAGLITNGRQGVTVRNGFYNEGAIEWKDCEMHISASTNTNPQYSVDGLGMFDASTNLADLFSEATNAYITSSVDTPYLSGNPVIKCTRLKGDGRDLSWSFTGTSGLTYSASIMIYDPNNHITLWGLNGSGTYFTDGGTIPHSNGWKRIWVNGTSNYTGVNYFFIGNLTVSAFDETVWVSELMIEQKSVPTTYTETSRTLGVFAVTGSIGMDQCTVSFKHKVTAPTTSFPTIMNIGWYSNPITQDGIAFYRGTGWSSGNTITFSTWCQATAAQPYAANVTSNAYDLEGHELYYAVAYKTGSGDGTISVRVKDLTTDTMVFTTDQTGKTFSWTHLPRLYLGTLNGGSHQQGWYRDLSVYDRALTSTELDKLVSSPFQIYEEVTTVSKELKETSFNPTGSYNSEIFYWPLINSSASLYDDILPSEVTNEVYEGNRGIFVGSTVINLLDTNYRNLMSASDIQSTSTKTLVEAGKYEWVNDGSTTSNIRLFCLLTSLTNGVTYNCSIKYEDLVGRIQMDWCDQSMTGSYIADSNTDTGTISGKLTATSVRSTYDSTYRFLDIKLDPGTRVTLFEPQVEARLHETPFADPARTSCSLEFNLSGSIGLDWSGDWTISYWKYPVGTHSGMTGYSIESLGCNSNSVGGGYVFWGKSSGTNGLYASTPSAFDPDVYFRYWHMVTLVKNGTTVTIRTRGIQDIENSVRTYSLSGISSNYYVTQYGYDFKLGGWDNGNSNNSFFRDLVVAKRAFTEAEQDNLYNQMKVRLNDGVYIKQLKEKGI